ncbi:hypothetical protein ACOMHN_062029 [Nucella lapillus]
MERADSRQIRDKRRENPKYVVSAFSAPVIKGSSSSSLQTSPGRTGIPVSRRNGDTSLQTERAYQSPDGTGIPVSRRNGDTSLQTERGYQSPDGTGIPVSVHTGSFLSLPL